MQADNLGELVNATGREVKDNISFKYLSLMYSGMAAEERGQVSIQSQKLQVEEQIAIITVLAETAGVDISFCLNNYNNNIESTTNHSLSTLADCVDTRIGESGIILKRFDPLVDAYYLKVTNISAQIDLCQEDNCLAPIIEFIATQQAELPTKINLEQTRAYELFEILTVAMTNCQEGSVAEYIFATTMTLDTVQECSNSLLDSSN